MASPTSARRATATRSLLSGHPPAPRTGESPAAWLPLQQLAELLDASGSDPGLDPHDFAYCGSVERRGLPTIHRYLHVVTRRRLAIDETLHAWRYSPTTPGALGGYLPIPYLAEAVDMLDLVRAERLKQGASGRRFIALYSDEAETGPSEEFEAGTDREGETGTG
ncbi:MAG: hypothetical protein NVSMB16_02050 [Acidimicrobiales bacterium]